jgi:hypothetical protein
MDTDLDPLWREVFEGEDSTHSIFELDTFEKNLVGPWGQNALEFDDVALDQPVGRVGRSEGQIPIIGEQN